MSVTLRNNTWHLRRRVPSRFAAIEHRKVVSLSLRASDRTEAEAVADETWAYLMGVWEARLGGMAADPEDRYAAARDLAGKMGFRYLPVDKVADLPLDDLMERMRAIVKASAPAAPNMPMATALLGLASDPPITISRALAIFYDLAGDATRGKSPDQVRRWRAPYARAAKNFIEVNGDIVVRDLDADHMLSFTDWWQIRMDMEGLSPGTANKDLASLAAILNLVNTKKRLGLFLPLTGYSFRSESKGTRPPFSTEWLKTKLLGPGALGHLHPQARCLLLGMINTGYRPSEAAGLLPEHIRLDVTIPHILIEPDGRTLKSKSSRRVIPLCGVSLKAFKQSPGGFPHYQDNPNLSGTINAYLRKNGLLESPAHTLYGLRHAFEDRMLAAGVDERIRRDLMGHSLQRQRYGRGADLEHLQKVVESVAI